MAAFKETITGISRKEDLTEKKDMEKDLAENVESNQSADVIGAGLQVIDSFETRPLKCFINSISFDYQRSTFEGFNFIYIPAYPKSDRQSSHRY